LVWFIHIHSPVHEQKVKLKSNGWIFKETPLQWDA